MQKQLLERLVRNTEVVSIDELKNKLKKNPVLKIGVDPTSSFLHLGHLVLFRKIKEFYEAGATVKFIIGDFTARIGDPSGQSAERKLLRIEEINSNAREFEANIKRFLPFAEIVYNSSWFENMKLEDFLKLTRLKTIQQIISREDFSRRIKSKSPLTLMEVLYPVLQGYDSYILKADIEIGGQDQIFNMLVGRDIQQAFGMEPQVCITMPLIVGTDGIRKMSKSYNNAIGLNETPDEIFGKIMSISDGVMWDYIKLLTDFNVDELKSKNPRDVKLLLAYDVVRQIYGVDEASRARDGFIKRFVERDFSKVQEVYTTKKNLIDLLVELGVKSRNEARRLIIQGAIEIDGVKVRELPQKTSFTIRIGKKKFFKVNRG